MCLIENEQSSYQRFSARKASLGVQKQHVRCVSKSKSRIIFESERPKGRNPEHFLHRGAGKSSFAALRINKNSVYGRAAFHKKPLNFVQKLKKERDNVLQKELSSVIKRMVKVSIAHGMDPVQRAGQTSESNAREAAKYGRKAKGRRRFFTSLFKLLLKLFFLAVFPIVSFKDVIVDCILKVWEDKHKNNKKGKKWSSFAERVLLQRKRQSSIPLRAM